MFTFLLFLEVGVECWWKRVCGKPIVFELESSSCSLGRQIDNFFRSLFLSLSVQFAILLPSTIDTTTYLSTLSLSLLFIFDHSRFIYPTFVHSRFSLSFVVFSSISFTSLLSGGCNNHTHSTTSIHNLSHFSSSIKNSSLIVSHALLLDCWFQADFFLFAFDSLRYVTAYWLLSFFLLADSTPTSIASDSGSFDSRLARLFDISRISHFDFFYTSILSRLPIFSLVPLSHFSFSSPSSSSRTFRGLDLASYSLHQSSLPSSSTSSTSYLVTVRSCRESSPYVTPFSR